MSYNFLFKKAGRILKSYLDSVSDGRTDDAEKNKKVYEEYFRQRAKREEQNTGQNYRRQSSGNEGQKKSEPLKDDKYFYSVLGINPGASAAEIKSAYKKMIIQYHPDKVVNLGPELQSLAKKKTQEINEAYQYLKTKANF